MPAADDGFEAIHPCLTLTWSNAGCPAADYLATAALRPLLEVVVLLIVAAVLAVLWLLGVVAFHITAFAIHLLLIIAVVVVIAHFVTRGRSRA